MRRVPRAEALAALRRRPPPACLICDLVARRRRVVAETPRSLAVLDAFPRQWGHTLVMPKRHATRFAELGPAGFVDAAALAARVASALEGLLPPARVYVASLGTDRLDLPMSSPHLHLHVLPVPDPRLRPREVLTWRRGVVAASPAEWSALRRGLRAALAVDGRGAAEPLARPAGVCTSRA